MTRLKDLEDQTEQHSRLQEKMTERLKMMDDHAQHQGQQVMLWALYTYLFCVIVLLSISLNMCFGCSKEPSVAINHLIS